MDAQAPLNSTSPKHTGTLAATCFILVGFVLGYGGCILWQKTTEQRPMSPEAMVPVEEQSGEIRLRVPYYEFITTYIPLGGNVYANSDRTKTYLNITRFPRDGGPAEAELLWLPFVDTQTAESFEIGSGEAGTATRIIKDAYNVYVAQEGWAIRVQPLIDAATFHKAGSFEVGEVGSVNYFADKKNLYRFDFINNILEFVRAVDSTSSNPVEYEGGLF